MKNQICPDGLRPHRKKGNYREEVFAHEWRNEHGMFSDKDFLGLLLSPTEGRSNGITNITQRERVIVATVIQWLGTNVGQSFIEVCMKKIGKTITYSKDHFLLANGWTKVNGDRWVLLREDMPFQIREPQTENNATLMQDTFQHNRWD